MGRVTKTGHTIPFLPSSFPGDQTRNHTHTEKKTKTKTDIIIRGQRGKQLERLHYRNWKFISGYKKREILLLFFHIRLM